MTSRLWSAALVLAVLVGGCSSPESEKPAADSTDLLAGADLSLASEAQAAEITDRKVTATEYRAAFQRFRTCLSAAGFDLANVELNNGVFDFVLPDAAVRDGADQKCYQREYYFTDMLWQMSPR